MPPKHKDSSQTKVVCLICKDEGNAKTEFTKKNIQSHTAKKHHGKTPHFRVTSANQSLTDMAFWKREVKEDQDPPDPQAKRIKITEPSQGK